MNTFKEEIVFKRSWKSVWSRESEENILIVNWSTKKNIGSKKNMNT